MDGWWCSWEKGTRARLGRSTEDVICRASDCESTRRWRRPHHGSGPFLTHLIGPVTGLVLFYLAEPVPRAIWVILLPPSSPVGSLLLVSDGVTACLATFSRWGSLVSFSSMVLCVYDRWFLGILWIWDVLIFSPGLLATKARFGDILRFGYAVTPVSFSSEVLQWVFSPWFSLVPVVYFLIMWCFRVSSLVNSALVLYMFLLLGLLCGALFKYFSCHWIAFLDRIDADCALYINLSVIFYVIFFQKWV